MKCGSDMPWIQLVQIQWQIHVHVQCSLASGSGDKETLELNRNEAIPLIQFIEYIQLLHCTTNTNHNSSSSNSSKTNFINEAQCLSKSTISIGHSIEYMRNAEQWTIACFWFSIWNNVTLLCLIVIFDVKI